MYKKILLISALFNLFAIIGQNKQSWFEIKPSYFLFYSCPMKEVYNNGGFQIQGSATLPCCNYFDIYASLGYRKAKGHSVKTTFTQDQTVETECTETCSELNIKNPNEYGCTKLTVVPVDIGLKYIFNPYSRFYCFFALGPRYFCLHQYNNSPYVDSIINKSGIGLFANAGVNLILGKRFLFGIFGECSYEKKTIYPKMAGVYSNGSVQIGGFAVGASVGYVF
jgi:outer membrane protein W